MNLIVKRQYPRNFMYVPVGAFFIRYKASAPSLYYRVDEAGNVLNLSEGHSLKMTGMDETEYLVVKIKTVELEVI